MKARLFKDEKDNQYKILCADGTIAEANTFNLSKMLRESMFIGSLSGNLGRWIDFVPNMFAYQSQAETYAYVSDEGELIIINFTPFDILFQTSDYALDNFIGVSEFADAVGKSIEQVKVFLRNGRIPDSRKIGRDWIIHKDSINKYPSDHRLRSGKYKKREMR